MLLNKYFSSLKNDNKEPEPKAEDMANGDNLVPVEGLPVDLDDNFNLDSIEMELERLQLERLKLQQAQLECKERMLIKQAERKAMVQPQPNTRCVLPDGKIILTNVPESNQRDGDSGFTAGAGDSLKIPALQRVGSRVCVACGAPADSYCARCGVTPYCSARCQRRDWQGRHASVCHNLARMNAPLDVDKNAEVDITVPAPAPLRRPRSPPMRECTAPDNDNGSDRGSKKCTASGFNSVLKSAQAAQRNTQGATRNFNNRQSSNNQPDKPNRQPDKSERQFDKSDRFNRQDRQGQDGGTARPPLRRPQVANDDEDRRNAASKPKSIPQTKDEPKPAPVPKPPLKESPTPLAKKMQAMPAPANQSAAPLADQKEAKSPAINLKPPGSVADTTPTTKLVPKNCLVEILSKDDTALLTVESLASDCHTKGTGYVCVSIHEKYSAEYEALCDEYGAACEADTTSYKPAPGETFSYFNAEDAAWYRARCLSTTHCALLDACKVVALENARTVRLPEKYGRTPEFSALLQATVNVGDSLSCVLMDKTANGWKVSIQTVDGKPVGQGEVSRWLPTVQYPAPSAAAKSEVDRPAVTHNSSVLLVHMTDLNSVYVRPLDTASQRAFDEILHGVAYYGVNATPLSQPPTVGAYVVSKFEDGNHYRALVKRTNYKQNKYLLEYVEYGNTQINTLENLYPCPDNYHPQTTGVLTSRVALQMTSQLTLTPPAEQYLDQLKEDAELILSIPGGAKTAPSGSAVLLTVSAKNENVNRKVEELCTPERVKLEQCGGDVLETESLMYKDLKFQELPEGPCELCIVDYSELSNGSLSACLRADADRLHRALAAITERMEKYCDSELGREPYLPKAEELCIAKMPPFPQWFRAVLVEHVDGPGGAEAEVCYIDYGNMSRVPVSQLRKMLPEFIRELPAIAHTLEIRDFPKNATVAMLERAFEHIQPDVDDRGTLRVTRCQKEGPGLYIIDAPELIASMTRN